MADEIIRNLRIYSTERLELSFYGNPRFKVTFDTEEGLVTYQTMRDASVSYDIENFAGYTRRDPDFRVDIRISQNGRIRYMTKAGEMADIRRRPQTREPWTYKGVLVMSADWNTAGIRWEANIADDSRFGEDVPPRLRADTKDGMRELITHYMSKGR